MRQIKKIVIHIPIFLIPLKNIHLTLNLIPLILNLNQASTHPTITVKLPRMKIIDLHVLIKIINRRISKKTIVILFHRLSLFLLFIVDLIGYLAKGCALFLGKGVKGVLF